ncbi:hypothetical protein PF003_g20563 [Phytophthora fragariae]|nr:hypothetical protein PF003_g20563 [Phytophthora fragariae]
MPVAEFPGCGMIEKFLHCSEATMTKRTSEMRYFNQTWDYTEYAKTYVSDGASFAMEFIGHKVASMKITKTRTWYDTNQANLSHLKEELNGLMDTTVGTLVQIISKKGWARQKLLQK